ncbi:MAG TPA: palindromic element RPE4 domain-containing protein [Rickettsia endosymbiont of Omalisus fontisbellaquei]|nr:palindromic element RPE4 domain-containing protein [Rickettsia endosymbiont of Omalisus fontisbellaquei]
MSPRGLTTGSSLFKFFLDTAGTSY